MLTPGHIAISYLISQLPIKRNEKLSSKEIIFVILCGNSFDFDFFLPPLFGYPGGIHHYFPTHTPIFGVILFLSLYLVLRKNFSKKTFVLAGLAMTSHLILDDFNYWLGLIGLDKGITTSPQILWEWPFNFFGRKKTFQEAIEYYRQNPITNSDILAIYTKSKLFVIEIITVFVAVIVFMRNKVIHVKMAKEEK